MGFPAIVEGGDQPACTDNFQIKPFVLDGRRWQSVEQCFQAYKFGSEELVERIRSLRPTPDDDAVSFARRVLQEGRVRDPSFRPDWELIKQEVMYRAVRAKFSCNPDARAELLATGTRGIQHPEPGFWGEWNTNIVLRIREELRPPGEGRDEALLSALILRFEVQRAGHTSTLPTLVALDLPTGGSQSAYAAADAAGPAGPSGPAESGAWMEQWTPNLDSSVFYLDVGNAAAGQCSWVPQASLFSGIVPEVKTALAKRLVETEEARRSPVAKAVGSLVALAAADATGHWFEFMDACDTPGVNRGGSVRSCNQPRAIKEAAVQWRSCLDAKDILR